MKYVDGDLLELFESGEFDVIVHGCNCFNNMGRGIAKQIAGKYPKAATVDNTTKRADYNKLGNYSECYINDSGKIIINAYTQFYPGSGSLNLCALRLVFEKIKCKYNKLRIGIPKIGAGLAGGDWNIIEKIINAVKIENITCVNYNGDK